MKMFIKSAPKIKGTIRRIPVKMMITITLFVAMLIGGSGIYFYWKITSDPAYQTIKQSEEDQRVLEQLKKILLLPDNFTPSMAIITDAENLKKSQPGFFGNAKNGQRLIVYQDTAIIFDAEANKIIKIGGIQINNIPPLDTPPTVADKSNGQTKTK